MTGPRSAMFILVGLAGLLIVIAAFSGWQGATRLANRGDDTADAEAAARAFVEAYGSFDYREPEAYRARLLRMTTGVVQAAFRDSGTDPVALGQRRTSRTTVVSSSVSALSDDAAAVSVTAEQMRQGTDPESGEPIEEHVLQRINCRLARQDGQWLVAEFRLQSEEPLQ